MPAVGEGFEACISAHPSELHTMDGSPLDVDARFPLGGSSCSAPSRSSPPHCIHADSTRMPPSMSFYLRGLAALVALFLVTLLMDATPAVNALRALIGIGLGIVGLKTVLRYYGGDWPRR